jgi:hypothetical protein
MLIAMSDKNPCAIPQGDEMAAALLDQVFDLWVLPEITARGLQLGRDQVTRALVTLEPSAVPKVSINDEAMLSVRMPAPGPVAAGEAIPIDSDAVSGLRPLTVDADAAWIAFAVLGDHVIVAFDFRRDRATALALLDRADAFLRTANAALAAGDEHPAVETGWAAAELGAMAQMLVIGGSLQQSHQARERWFANWTSRKLRNAPRAHHQALARLAELRPWARYGVAALPPRPGELEQRLPDVGDLLAAARGFVGEPLPDLELPPAVKARPTST